MERTKTIHGPRRAYVAGKFRGPKNADVQRHIDVASWFQAPIGDMGIMPVCVHSMEGVKLHDVQQNNAGQFWLDVTMDELRTCDAVVVVPGWQSSSGTFYEVEEALRLGMPVFEAAWAELCVGPTEMPAPAPTEEWIQITELGGTAGDAYVEDYSDYSFAAWVADDAEGGSTASASVAAPRGPAAFYVGDRVVLSGVTNSRLRGAEGVVTYVNSSPGSEELFNVDVQVAGRTYGCRASELTHAEVN